MTQPAKVVAHIRELWPVFLVVLAVVVISTLAGSVLDRRHKVVAEETSGPTVQAVAGPDQTQVLTITPWQVQLTLPLAPELPLVSFAPHSANNIGLSSADLAALGPDCSAAANTLGTLLRNPAGQPLPVSPSTIRSLVATVNGYDYHYDMPQNSCANTPAGQILVNRQTPIVLEALGNLTAIPATSH